jgi:hypothetical protein
MHQLQSYQAYSWPVLSLIPIRSLFAAYSAYVYTTIARIFLYPLFIGFMRTSSSKFQGTQVPSLSFNNDHAMSIAYM